MKIRRIKEVTEAEAKVYHVPTVIGVIKLTSIVSSNLKGIAYVESEQRLFVQFRNEAVYQVMPFPAEAFDRFSLAPSKGGFYNLEIRNNKAYDISKIAEAGPDPRRASGR